jgi:putative DNA primase/helicase
VLRGMSSSNYDSVLSQLQSFGLEVDRLEIDTPRWVYCRTSSDKGKQKKGWYHLRSWRTQSGVDLVVGSFGDFRTGQTLRVELKKAEIGKDELAALRAKVAEDRKKAEAIRRHRAEVAARRAEKFWQACATTGHCEYLVRKQCGAAPDVRCGKGNIVIPMRDAHGMMAGLQIIYGDPKTKRELGRDKTYWPSGLAKQGKYFQIGVPSWIVLVAEGYATAMSLHEATGLPVAVAFDAGNLEPVARALRGKGRDLKILLCADDDYATRDAAGVAINPGVSKANLAAVAVGGAHLVPQFRERPEGTKWTDFNDLRCAEGLPTVKAQVDARLAELGWAPPAADVEPDGGQGNDGVFPQHPSIHFLLKHYTVLYGKEGRPLFDGFTRQVIKKDSLDHICGGKLVKAFMEHPDRRLLPLDRVIFDPRQPADAAGYCNLWGGWDTQPKKGSCEKTLELLERLCSDDTHSEAILDWLIKWIAYPVQHPGAKMKTAVLMHGGEGTGKNTLWEIVRDIYGRYGGEFSQNTLEDKYNDWLSGKLFMIGNEVLARSEVKKLQGQIKTYVTEEYFLIRSMYQNGRRERNCCNLVFLSNRLDIATLDQDDRRFCVIWTPTVPQELISAVYSEREAGGVAAFHDYLLSVDLSDFHPWTRPPVGSAKRDLIDRSRDSIGNFADEWRADDWRSVGLQPTALTTETLYRLYLRYCRQAGEPWPVPRKKFLLELHKRHGYRRPASATRYLSTSGARLEARFMWPPGVECPPGVNQQIWLGEQEAVACSVLEGPHVSH